MLLINPLCCVNGRVILLETISNPSNLSIFDFSWYPSPNLLYYIQICEEILNFDVIIHKPSCNPQYYVNNCIVSLESISLPLEHFIKINYFCFLEFDVIRTKTIAAWNKITAHTMTEETSPVSPNRENNTGNYPAHLNWTFFIL